MTVFVVIGGPRIENHYREIADTILAPHGHVEWVEWLDNGPVDGRDEHLDRAIATADAVVSTPWLGAAPQLAMPEFGEARFSLAPRLRTIAGTFDFRLGWVDSAAAARRGVALIDSSRSMTPTVAEFGLAMTLNLLRGIPEAIESVQRGGWSESPPDGGGYVYGDLAGRRVGLAGYGSINRRYRSFLGPFGCDVATCDPYVPDTLLRRDAVTRSTSLVDLAARSEIFVVGIPPTPATSGIIDGSVIAALPRGTLFVLLTRMAVVQQDSLWRRLADGELRAAIDVFDPEPPPRNAWFRNSPNVLATPHIAGNARHAHRRCFETACRDAVAILAGGLVEYRVHARDARIYDGSITA